MTSMDGQLPDSKHLREDINIPEDATTEEPDPSFAGGITSSTNAGQHAAGLMPVDGDSRSAGDSTAPEAEES